MEEQYDSAGNINFGENANEAENAIRHDEF